MANGNESTNGNGNRMDWYKIVMGIIAAGSIIFASGITYLKVNDTYGEIKTLRHDLNTFCVNQAKIQKDIEYHDARIKTLESKRNPGG